MYFFVTPISALLLINSFILLSLSVFLFTDKQRHETKIYAMLMLSIAVWAFFGAAESAAITIPAKIYFAKATYFGILAVGPLWLLFTLRYIKARESLIGLVKIITSVIYILMLGLLLSNSYHHLLWTSYNQIGGDIRSGVIFGHGAAWYVNVALQYLMIVIGLVLLFRAAINNKGGERRSLLLIAIATVVPWIANFIFIYAGPTITKGADLAPITFCISGLIIVFSIYKYRFFNTVTLAVDTVYRSIKTGIVIFDKDRRVIDFNDSAKKMIGSHLEKSLAVNLLDAKTSIPFARIISGKEKDTKINIKDKWLLLTAQEINDGVDVASGYAVTISDISKTVENELKLDAQLTKISKMNDLMVGRELKMVEMKKAIKEANIKR